MPLSILIALVLQTTSPPGPTEPEGEIVVLSPSRPVPQTPATMVVEPVAMMIAALDGDGDGRTTRAEMETGVARSFAAIDTVGAGTLRYLAFASWAERFLGDRNALPSPFEVDKDGNDQVSLDELQRQFSRLFARYNRDGDDAISRPELLTFRTAPVDAKGPTPPLDPRRKRPKPDRAKPERTPR